MVGLSIKEHAIAVEIWEACGCNVKVSKKGKNSRKLNSFFYKISLDN